MNAIGRRFVPLLAVLLLSACSTVEVKTDYDRAAAFGTYRTYTLAPGPDAGRMPVYSQAVLRSTLRAQLAIVWHAFLADKERRPEPDDPWFGTEWPYEYGLYTAWSVAPSRYTNTDPYPDGTLILDVVDLQTRKLVFRGMATAMVVDPKRSAKNIEKAVAKMIEALPGRR